MKAKYLKHYFGERTTGMIHRVFYLVNEDSSVLPAQMKLVGSYGKHEILPVLRSDNSVTLLPGEKQA